MTAEMLAAWLLGVMLTAVPPGHSRHPPEARETAAQGRARYAAIAESIAKVSLDPKEAPLFAGEDGRAKTAALMLAISYYESHWRRHVDLRPGRGRYHCLMQIAVDKGRTEEGWTARQLVGSRERCFRTALHILQRGQRLCRDRGPRAFLNHYASGYCDRGRKAVGKRWQLWSTWLRKHPWPKKPEP